MQRRTSRPSLWTFVSSKDEQYRLLIESDDEEALVATDIDIDPGTERQEFWKVIVAKSCIDLRNMRVLSQRGGGTEAGRIEVIPESSKRQGNRHCIGNRCQEPWRRANHHRSLRPKVTGTEVTARNTSVAVIDINTAPLLVSLTSPSAHQVFVESLS
ncbi:MAG: hypothetical protein IPH49_14260 [Ignavibacteria bacterium]|nr:hypothetical protein [Ignavibacteria bacterium]